MTGHLALVDVLRPGGVDRLGRRPQAHPARAVPLGATTTAARATVKASGSLYFKRDTVKFFHARAHGVFGGRFLVESVQNVEWTAGGPPEPRQFRVTWFVDDGQPGAQLQPERSRDWDNVEDAKRAARWLANTYPLHEEGTQR